MRLTPNLSVVCSRLHIRRPIRPRTSLDLPHPVPGIRRSYVVLRASTQEDNDPLEEENAASALAADNTLQALFMLLTAAGVSSWQNLDWNWEWPAGDMAALTVLCAALPLAFTFAVCLPAHDAGPVVGALSKEELNPFIV